MARKYVNQRRRISPRSSSIILLSGYPNSPQEETQ